MSDLYNYNKYKINPDYLKLIQEADPKAIKVVKKYLEKVPEIVAEFIISFWLDLYVVRVMFRLSVEVAKKYKEFYQDFLMNRKFSDLKECSLTVDIYPIMKDDLTKAKKDVYLMFLYLASADTSLTFYVRKGRKCYEGVEKEMALRHQNWRADSSAHKSIVLHMRDRYDSYINSLKTVAQVVLEPDKLKRTFNKILKMNERLELLNQLTTKIIIAAKVVKQDGGSWINRDQLSNSMYCYDPVWLDHFWVPVSSPKKSILNTYQDICCGDWRDYDPEFIPIYQSRVAARNQKAIEKIRNLMDENYTADDIIDIFRQQEILYNCNGKIWKRK